MSYKLKSRLWLEYEGETLIGGGKLLLLEKTAELGSLRKAAEVLNLSYRKAWYSLNQMNKAAPSPLIILKRGGKNGGKAELTQKGEMLLEAFAEVQKRQAEFLQQESRRIIDSLNTEEPTK